MAFRCIRNPAAGALRPAAVRWAVLPTVTWLMRHPVLNRCLYALLAAATTLPLSGPGAYAQTAAVPAVPEKLTLKEAIALAIQHNPRHRDSLIAVQDARSRWRSAGELRRGTWDSSLTQTYAEQRSGTLDSMFGSSFDIARRDGSSLALSAELPWVGNAGREGEVGVGLTMPLTRGRGRVSSTQVSLDRAQLALRNAELNHFLNQQSLVQQVVTAYFNAVRAGEQVKVQERAVARSQQFADDEKKRLDAGLSIEVDLTSAQIRLAQDRERLENQIQAYRNALDELVLLMGLPVGTFPELTEPVEYTPIEIDLDAAIREALANRAELERYRIQKAQAEIDLEVARDQKRPRADLTANLTNVGIRFLTSGGGIGSVLSSIFGLRVSVPVSKTTLAENQAQAERQRDVLEYLERFDRQSIVDEVRGFWRAAESAKRNYDLNTTNLQFAQRKLQIAQRLIDEGIRTNRDLLEAQREVTDAETSLLNTKVSYLLTLVSLRRAMGQDLLRQYGIAPLELPERPDLVASGAERQPRAATISEQVLFGREAYPAALR